MFERHTLRPIGSSKEGAVVHIRGTVRAGGGDLLLAPLSGRPCVAWTLNVSEDRGNNFGTVHDERTLRPFFVDDDHDTAFVTPVASRLSLIEDTKFDSLIDKPVPGLVAHLKKGDFEMRPQARYIVREGILSEGEPIAVVGRGRWESDPMRSGEGYRSIGRRLVVTNGPGGAVHITDDPSLPRLKAPKKPRPSSA
ncbi:MAG: hypothetical protein AB8H86_13970 [Polyangiales bacterium]